MTTIQAAKVPSPPNTAVSGRSKPKARTLPGGFHSRSVAGYRWRSLITERWAIVKESIAPNE
jgi:hypothetical protein